MALFSKVNQIATKTILDHAKGDFVKGNFVFSPFSMEIILSLIASGSKGQTLTDLLYFLGVESLEELHSDSQILKLFWIISSSSIHENGGPEISVANGVWIQEHLSLLASYKGRLQNIYKTRAKSVDFQTQADGVARRINAWVNKKTKSLIRELVTPSDFNDDITMIIANTLYFKGLWEYEFEERMTKKKKFHLFNGDIVKVPFMRSNNKSCYYGTYHDFKILQLSYKNDRQTRFSMSFFLPKKRNGLLRMTEQFDSNPRLFQNKFDLKKVKLNRVRIPKFKISYNLDPLDSLKGMGLVSPFQMRKEFTGMVDSPEGDSLFVSKILQKSFIEVEEKGTKAASVTEAFFSVMSKRKRPCTPAPGRSFVANHPFMFMVREHTSDAILFIGVVLNPKQVS